MRNERLVRGPVGLLAALAAVVYAALAWAPKRRSRPRAVRANVADVAAGVEVEEALFEDGLHEGGVDVFVEVHQMRDSLLQNNAGDVFRCVNPINVLSEAELGQKHRQCQIRSAAGSPAPCNAASMPE